MNRIRKFIIKQRKHVIKILINGINNQYFYVDPPNLLTESKTNNYVLKPFVRAPIKAYLEVNTGSNTTDSAITDYLTQFIDRQPSISSNYLNIIIGKNGNTFKNTINPYTQSFLNNKFYYDNLGIKYNRNYIGYTPYNGVVSRFYDLNDGNTYVVAYGEDIDGDVAAVKKLISAQSLFLDQSSSYNERTVIIDNYDLTGMSVMDLFHNPINFQFYNQNRGTDNFKNVVSKILNDNSFEIAIKTVKTTNDNTTLRLKNVNVDYSPNFVSAIVNNQKPVVLARGFYR